MSSRPFPVRCYAIVVVIVISMDVASSNGIGSGTESSPEKFTGQSKIGEELDKVKNINTFKTKVSPKQEAELMLNGRIPDESIALLGTSYMEPDENGVVLIGDRASEYPDHGTWCDEGSDPRCQYLYVTDDIGRGKDVLEPSYFDGQNDMGAGFGTNLVPNKRRLRFVKRRLRFIKKNGGGDESSSIDKRRLRFIKRDEEEFSADKRRLRFIKRRLRFHKKNFDGYYPNGIEFSSIPDYEYAKSFGLTNRYVPTQQSVLKEPNFATNDDVISQKNNAALSRMYKSHAIQRRSAPPSLFDDLDTLTLDPPLNKRHMSINQPLHLVTQMLMAREKERRMEAARLRSDLLKLGKRSEMSTTKNSAILSKLLDNLVQSYLTKTDDQSNYKI